MIRKTSLANQMYNNKEQTILNSSPIEKIHKKSISSNNNNYLINKRNHNHKKCYHKLNLRK